MNKAFKGLLKKVNLSSLLLNLYLMEGRCKWYESMFLSVLPYYCVW